MRRSEHDELKQVVALLQVSNQRQAAAISMLQHILADVARELAKEDAETSRQEQEAIGGAERPL